MSAGSRRTGEPCVKSGGFGGTLPFPDPKKVTIVDGSKAARPKTTLSNATPGFARETFPVNHRESNAGVPRLLGLRGWLE